MIVKVKSIYNGNYIPIDGIITYNGHKGSLDDISEIIFEGDDFSIDIDKEENRIRIIKQ